MAKTCAGTVDRALAKLLTEYDFETRRGVMVALRNASKLLSKRLYGLSGGVFW
eukprot:CAMPEP_0182515104 /NCGR_PEP_ID=MMETSP1321-20130603/37396_1 /TAXON_ID=91990 /ORGANISM="Bolidomonas sp., Strain RCC1657" /LENGTH=52 /DNA_ID=CAMNT_0024722463 /DNA_START=92 /DNA_END=247 /DNA_ORIENTATION=+